MPSASPFRPAAIYSIALLAPLLSSAPARAQVTEVVVGVTPSCPYGIGACWAGAYEALGRLDGVKSVAKHPDSYNCTAQLELKAGGLPDVGRWAGQFKSFVGQVYTFRGVEVTVEGSLEAAGDEITLRVPGLDSPIPVGTLEHKLQWNFRKSSARKPEPDEHAAYGQLVAARKAAKPGDLKVRVTGPIRKTQQGMMIEVREFYLSGQPAG